ncbi:hypothetical protein WA158_005535 [Blastocystis sp. Blastoise]
MSLKEGEAYILYANDGMRRVDVARPGDYVKIRRQSFPVTDLIGHEYGTVFEAQGKHLVPTNEPLEVVDETEIDNEEDTHDNRDLVDTNDAQALRQEQIKQLKSSGLTGDDLVKAIAESSKTFETKTEFSQKKYLRKKAQKHVVRCLLVETNAHTIIEQQFLKNPSKINFMRFDALATLISRAQVMAGKSIGVFDECMGIVVGACAERMGGYGHLYRIYEEQAPADDCVNRFNFPPNIKYWINPIHINDLLAIENQDYHEPLIDLYNEENMKMLIIKRDDEEKKEKCVEVDAQGNLIFKKDFTEKEKQVILRKKQIKEYKNIYREKIWDRNNVISKGLDTIIIASNDPLTHVPRLLPYLSPAGIIAVYTPYVEVGTELYAGLKKSGEFVNLELTQNWMRKYQVLPMRTHPYMNMFNSSGCILTGIRVLSENNMKVERVYKKGNTAVMKVNKKRLRLF